MSGAAKLTDKFNNGQEIQFEVPLRRICRIANCKQMFPAGKKFFITLYKAPESFFLRCQDPAALNNIILQMTDCIIEVPTIELMDDLTLSGLGGGAQRPGWSNSQLPIRNLLSYDAQTW